MKKLLTTMLILCLLLGGCMPARNYGDGNGLRRDNNLPEAETPLPDGARRGTADPWAPGETPNPDRTGQTNPWAATGDAGQR